MVEYYCLVILSQSVLRFLISDLRFEISWINACNAKLCMKMNTMICYERKRKCDYDDGIIWNKYYLSNRGKVDQGKVIDQFWVALIICKSDTIYKPIEFIILY